MRIDVDGATVFVHTADRPIDPELPSVLLLHGAGQDHTLWRLQARALAGEGWNAVVPDLPGHRLSGGELLTSVVEMAEWAESLLDALEIGRVVVGGHSMGSLIAVQLAADHPEKVVHLVLTGAADRMPVNDDLLELAAAGDGEAVELVTGWSHSGAGRLGSAVNPGMWEPGVTRRMMGTSISTLAQDLRACDRHSFEGFDRITCPVTVIVGAVDRMTPVRSATRLTTALPDARLVEVPGVGHDIVSRAHRLVSRELCTAVREHF
jgi:pimeloyl-ACP methyl ester carboxylesterase